MVVYPLQEQSRSYPLLYSDPPNHTSNRGTPETGARPAGRRRSPRMREGDQGRGTEAEGGSGFLAGLREVGP